MPFDLIVSRPRNPETSTPVLTVETPSCLSRSRVSLRATTNAERQVHPREEQHLERLRGRVLRLGQGAHRGWRSVERARPLRRPPSSPCRRKWTPRRRQAPSRGGRGHRAARSGKKGTDRHLPLVLLAPRSRSPTLTRTVSLRAALSLRHTPTHHANKRPRRRL